MMDVVMAIACFYFAYSCIAPVFREVPFGQWELVHYLSIVVGLLLVAVGVMKALQALRKEQAKRAEATADDGIAAPAEISDEASQSTGAQKEEDNFEDVDWEDVGEEEDDGHDS